jgi:rod shape-determining protein MreC
MGRYRNITIFGAAIIFQVLGLAIQVKRSTENESSRLIRVWAVSAITPLEKVIIRVQSSTSNVWHNYFYLRGVRQENRDLREQIEQLRLEQVRLKQDADQAHRLQALLGFKEQFIAKTLAAQVIGSSGSEQSRTVYLDKGSRDGIQPDMAVISADGVVGKIINVYKSTSQVLLINDQQSGVGAILEQSRLQGVLKGQASGELVIDKIMADEQVKTGDRVLTSGGDQIFPKGLPVGTVAKVSKGPEFLQVEVKPAAILSHLEEVLVITKREEHEQPVSTATTVRAADILAQRLPSVPDKPVASPGAPVVASGSTSAGATLPNTGNTHPAPSTTGTAVTGAQTRPSSNPAVASTGSKPAAPSGPDSKSAMKPGTATGAGAIPVAKAPAATPSKPAANNSPTQPQPDTPGDTPQ